MYYDCGGEWGPVTFPAFKAFFGLCLEKSSHANTRHFNEMRKQRRATTCLVAPRIAKRSDPRSDTGNCQDQPPLKGVEFAGGRLGSWLAVDCDFQVCIRARALARPGIRKRSLRSGR